MTHFDPARRATQTPRVLWIELTSKCPYDCVFCSRKFRRGSGRHLPFAVYRRLVESLVDPRRLLLNYSGESIYYPELIPAIELGRGRGAFVELVSAFSSIPRELVAPLAHSGLGRLTISLHATDPAMYGAIYGYSSFEQLCTRLAEFLSECGKANSPPSVDLAFVAMERNLDQLRPVAEFARSIGVSDITVFPVMRRDDIPVQFPVELDGGGDLRAEFSRRVANAVAEVRSGVPGIRLIAGGASGEPACLGEVPIPFSGPLPEGACIHTCEQNPWETAHVLSNGDVVVCEVLDKAVLGNIAEQPVEEVWHGDAYAQFRRRYHAGGIAECRKCAWKHAYFPAPPKTEILARDGGSAQLLHGWHAAREEDAIWSSQHSQAILGRRSGSASVHVSAILPAGSAQAPNELRISCDGADVGRVINSGAEPLPFGLNFPVPPGTGEPWILDFRTTHMLRPRDRGLSADTRDLGFALVLLKSNPRGNGRRAGGRELESLRRWIRRVDRLGWHLRHRQVARFGRRYGPPAPQGISIVIPERGNPAELSDCLESAEVAVRGLAEPAEIIVVVNGSPRCDYTELRRRYTCQWLFHQRELGFAEAIRQGLRAARHDWIYLLNSDITLAADALAQLLPLREPGVFAIGSQIFLKDTTRYREETNWTAFLLEDGLARVHDRIPQRDEATECFYVGGGASLFQRQVLEPLVRASAAYSPFYWEDVEWGWRARKRGYRVLFCPASQVRHRQHATIRRLYDTEAVEIITERNRLLFQLRNLTGCGSLERCFEEIGRAPAEVLRHLMQPRVLRSSLRVRLWNHLALRSDEALLQDAAQMHP